MLGGTQGPRLVGGGARRGDVEEIEAGAGPLGGADGGHRGWRASEPAAGPAGRCHVTVSSGPGGGGLGVSVLSAWFPAGPGLSFSPVLSPAAARPGTRTLTTRLSRARPGALQPPWPRAPSRCRPPSRLGRLGARPSALKFGSRERTPVGW